MQLSTTNIFNVAVSEVRTARRQFRFWTILFFLSLFSIVGYLIACAFLGYSAVTSPSMGTGVPKYLFGNIDPTFFLMFQMAALFLVFDIGHQHRQNRIIEVLESKPVTNFEHLAGRVLGIAGVLWLVAALNILVMQLIGWISTITNIGIADTIEWYSVFNLLALDGPVTLLIWCCFVVFLSSVLQIRLLVAMVGLASMFGWFFLVLNSPYSLLAIVSPSSNDTLFVSDLLPQLPSWPVMAIRITTILGALCLVVFSALLWRRQDSGGQLAKFLALGMCVSVGSLLAVWGSSSVLFQNNASKEWKEIHENTENAVHIDITSISGNVTIDPNRNLNIDLSMKFKTDTESADTFTFTFNPSMGIHGIQLNGSSPNFTFENGLLTVAVPNPLDMDGTNTMNITASGIPNERFAYFDNAYDYLNSPGVSKHAIGLLGTRGSVFNHRYVALMPGVYWYPVPGPVKGDYVSSQIGLDYFDLDLKVELTTDDWQLVGTEAIALASEGKNQYRVNPVNSLHEIGLFASEFESASIVVDGITFKMYLHKIHARNLSLLDEFSEAMKTVARHRFQRFSDHGLTLPYQTVSFVEVPRQLRTIGGSWRMDSLQTLPGVVLLKEHGYPTARLDLALGRLSTREQDKDAIEQAPLLLLSDYFRYGIATDNPWSGLPTRMWTHKTSAKGEYANILDQIILFLLSSLSQREHEFFSVYSTIHFADMTALSFFEGVVGFEYGLENDRVPSTIGTTRRLRSTHLERTSVWNDLETSNLADLPTSLGHQRDFELIMLKCKQIAIALLSINGEDKVFAWLESILASNTGQNYSYQELISRATEHGVIVDPFLTDWLSSSSLPGYAASNYTTFRISDGENDDPRYQTSVSIRNVTSVDGFVRLQFPTEESWDWSYPYLTESQGVRIDAGTTKQINLLTPYEIRSVYLDPGLSLHREPIRLTESLDSLEAPQAEELLQFEQASTWKPIKDLGIIVDDLDSGFSVEQQNISTNRPSRVGPVGWLRMPQLDVEWDNGLPFMRRGYMFEYRAPTGTWSRHAEHDAYGEFRKTIASTYVRNTRPKKATFAANVPESGLWNLDYHLPFVLDRDGQRGLKYNLIVSYGSSSSNVDLDVYNRNVGWVEVGEFDLDEGEIQVEIIGTSQRGILWADAIRWTKVEKN